MGNALIWTVRGEALKALSEYVLWRPHQNDIIRQPPPLLKTGRDGEFSEQINREITVAEEKQPEQLEGLGGWLILVGLGVVLSPLRIIGQTLPIYADVFSAEAWAALTTPGTEDYIPFLSPYLIAEVSINVGLVLAWIFIAFLFFSKKRAFPKWYIGTLLFTLVFVLIDALALKLVAPDKPVFDGDTVKELARLLVTTLIWVPYMLVSERVKLTFVR